MTARQNQSGRPETDLIQRDNLLPTDNFVSIPRRRFHVCRVWYIIPVDPIRRFDRSVSEGRTRPRVRHLQPSRIELTNWILANLLILG